MANLSQFDLGSAARIGRVVKAVEQEPRRTKPLGFAPVIEAGRQRSVFRVCTFTGSWQIGDSKTVTFKYQTTTPNTASVDNLFWPLGFTDYGERDCCIGKEGTAWFLVTPALDAAQVFTSVTNSDCELQFHTIPAIVLATESANVVTFSPGTVDIVDGVTVDTTSATPKLVMSRRQISAWCNNTISSTSINMVGVDVMQDATITSNALRFDRVKAWVFHQSTAETVSISITTCATATASP